VRAGRDEPLTSDPDLDARIAAVRAKGAILCGPGVTHEDLDMVEQFMDELRRRKARRQGEEHDGQSRGAARP